MPFIPQSTLQSFHYIRFHHQEHDAELVPDFMIIGPNRTGSTWLHDRLSRHPEVSFAFPKEVRYFDTLNLEHHPDHVSDDLDWYLRHFRLDDAQKSARQAQCRADFGRDFTPKVKGEASASYAAGIGPERIHDLLRLCPGLRAILLVRHPVDRVWSHIRFDAKNRLGLDTDSLSENQLRKILADEPYILECSRYSRMVELWEKHLKPGNLLPVRFDLVTQDPATQLTAISRFLGIDDEPAFFTAGDAYGIERPSPPMPPSLRHEVASALNGEFRYLRERFDVNWS